MLLEVGRVRRAHGLKGDVLVVLTSDLSRRLAPGSVLFGPRGPLTVIQARQQAPNWVVSFAEVADRTEAETLRGAVLRAEPTNAAPDDEGGVWLHQVLGAVVVEAGGQERGEVLEVHPQAQSDLLVLDTGALVPMAFVTDLVPTGPDGPGRITVEVPDGLFELYEDGK